MVKIKKQIHIDAPVERVFNFVNQPEKVTEIWPNMVRVENVKVSPEKGTDFDWEYKMAGMTFHGHSQTTKFVPNEHVEDENTGGFPSTMVWDFATENEGTLIDLEVNYEVPVPLLGKLAEKVIVKMNDNEIDTMLANLKAATEVQD